MKYNPVHQALFGNIQFYFGLVEEVLEDYTITFRVPEIIDNLDTYPKAHPTTYHEHEILKDDEVLILQMNSNISEFIYFPYDHSTFTGIRIGTTVIDLGQSENNGTIDIKVLKEAKESWDDEDEDPTAIITLKDDDIMIGTKSGKISIAKDNGTITAVVLDKAKESAIADDGASSSSITLEPDHIVMSTKSGGTVEIAKDTGIIDIKNNSGSLGALLDNLYTQLLQLKTIGGPTTQSASVWASAFVPTDQITLQNLLKV